MNYDRYLLPRWSKAMYKLKRMYRSGMLQPARDSYFVRVRFVIASEFIRRKQKKLHTLTVRVCMVTASSNPVKKKYEKTGYWFMMIDEPFEYRLFEKVIYHSKFVPIADACLMLFFLWKIKLKRFNIDVKRLVCSVNVEIQILATN